MNRAEFGGNDMFKYDFSYDSILTPSEVKNKGILYDDERFSFESYWEDGFDHYERLFYTDDNNVKAPFSGLLHGLYPNGIVSGYSFYKDGYQEGEDVHFYDDGTISEYTNYSKADSTALIIKWFRTGTISEIMELSDHGSHKKYIEYDENGNIISQGER